MAKGVFQATVIDQRTGKPLVGAKVSVLGSGSTLATLYVDRAASRQINNPLKSDLNGFVRGYVDPGTYGIKVVHEQGEISLTGVVLSDDTSATDKFLFERIIYQTDTGGPAPFSKVSVLNTSNTLATIYSPADQTVAITNPLLADNAGKVSFYIAPGRYNLLAEFHTGGAQLFKDIVMPNYKLGSGGAGGSIGGGGGGGGFDGNYLFNADPLSGSGTIVQENPLIYTIAGSGGSYGVVINYTTGLVAGDQIALEIYQEAVPTYSHHGSITLYTETYGGENQQQLPQSGSATLVFTIPSDHVPGATLIFNQFFNYEYPEVTYLSLTKV